MAKTIRSSKDLSMRVENAVITGVEKRREGGKHYVYVIDVTMGPSMEQHTVWRRYSTFFTLQEELKNTSRITLGISEDELPVLPAKKLLGRSAIRSVAEERMPLLQTYVSGLVNGSREIARSSELLLFFNPNSDDKARKAAGPPVEKQRKSAKSKSRRGSKSNVNSSGSDESSDEWDDEDDYEDTTASNVATPMRALFDYDGGVNSDDLSFNEGDIIQVSNRDDGDGWRHGSIGGKWGVFPASYVEPISSRPPPPGKSDKQSGSVASKSFNGGKTGNSFHGAGGANYVGTGGIVRSSTFAAGGGGLQSFKDELAKKQQQSSCGVVRSATMSQSFLPPKSSTQSSASPFAVKLKSVSSNSEPSKPAATSKPASAVLPPPKKSKISVGSSVATGVKCEFKGTQKTLNIPKPETWSGLSKILAEEFGERVRINFKDEDNDYVYMSCQEDVLMWRQSPNKNELKVTAGSDMSVYNVKP